MCLSALLPGGVCAEGIDTEHLFGFMIGTDVGNVGEREFQSQTDGRFARNGGTYRAIGQEFELEFVPVKNFGWSWEPPLRPMTSAAFQALRTGANWPGRAFP